MLLPSASLDRLEGVRGIDELDAAQQVAMWYRSLWFEVLTPRWLQAWLGERHAAPQCYAHFPIVHEWQVPARFAQEIMSGRRRNEVVARLGLVDVQ